MAAGRSLQLCRGRIVASLGQPVAAIDVNMARRHWSLVDAARKIHSNCGPLCAAKSVGHSCCTRAAGRFDVAAMKEDVLEENRCVMLTLTWYFEEQDRAYMMYR